SAVIERILEHLGRDAAPVDAAAHPSRAPQRSVALMPSPSSSHPRHRAGTGGLRSAARLRPDPRAFPAQRGRFTVPNDAESGRLRLDGGLDPTSFARFRPDPTDSAAGIRRLIRTIRHLDARLTNAIDEHAKLAALPLELLGRVAALLTRGVIGHQPKTRLVVEARLAAERDHLGSPDSWWFGDYQSTPETRVAAHRSDSVCCRGRKQPTVGKLRN